MLNSTYTLSNSDLNLFSSSASSAGIAEKFAPVKEFNPIESSVLFSFPKAAFETIGEEGKYTSPKAFTFFSILGEVGIKDLSQKPKQKLWGLFSGLKIEEEDIEEAKKSLFPDNF